MPRHQAVTEEISERASFYSLGLLDAAEAAEFESHLADCNVCLGEARAFNEIGAGLACSIPQFSPSPRVRQALFNRIAPEQVVIRSSEKKWQPTPFQGVEVKRLYLDPITRNITSLVRMVPGAQYPGHRHASLEQCFVLEGDLIFSDHTLHAGDCEINARGSDHSPVTTKQGCLVLIIHNEADQVFIQ